MVLLDEVGLYASCVVSGSLVYDVFGFVDDVVLQDAEDGGDGEGSVDVFVSGYR